MTTILEGFFAARARAFAAAADDYVRRVRGDEHRGDALGRAAQALHLRRKVMRQMVTGARRRLVYRFSHYLALCAAAGIDGLAICWDPPVTSKEARKALAPAATWIDGDALRQPGGRGHQVFLGTVPELACFGYILTEMLPIETLTILRQPLADEPATAATKLTRELGRLVATLAARSEMTDYYARVLRAVVAGFELAGGEEMALDSLTDDHVLACWATLADARPRKPVPAFGDLLRYVAALSEAARLALAEDAERDADAVDDPGVTAQVSGQSFTALDESPLDGLTRPLIRRLLNEDQRRILDEQVETFAPLIGLERSRMRASTFRPLENRLVQGKRNHGDLQALLDAAPGTTHAATLQAIDEACATIAGFADAAVHLLQADGRTTDARALAAQLGAASDEALAAMLENGARTWKRLERRVAFGAIAADPVLVDDMADAAVDAARLRFALARTSARLARAVDGCRDGTAFGVEHQMFCGALAQVHGLSAPGSRS